jgi:predicted transcriptional regulator
MPGIPKMKTSHGKPGPKPRGPYEGKRETITTRVTPGTRQKLDQTAEAADRSLSQEIELRLERSFDREDGLGGHRTAEVLRRLGHLAEASTDKKHWLDDYATFDAVMERWQDTLRQMMPKPIADRVSRGKMWVLRLKAGTLAPEAHHLALRVLERLSQNITLPPDARAEFAAAVAQLKEKDNGELA